MAQDDPALLRRLQRRGFEVVIAAEGKAGVAMAQAEKPDLVLMDMNMPELDGWEATRRIRANDATRRIPVIVASSDKWVREHAEGEGATTVPKEVLLDVIRR